MQLVFDISIFLYIIYFFIYKLYIKVIDNKQISFKIF